MYVVCMLIFPLNSARSHPSQVVYTSEIQLSCLETGTPLDWLWNSYDDLSRGHTEKCRARIVKAMSLDVA